MVAKGVGGYSKSEIAVDRRTQRGCMWNVGERGASSGSRGRVCVCGGGARGTLVGAFTTAWPPRVGGTTCVATMRPLAARAGYT